MMTGFVLLPVMVWVIVFSGFTFNGLYGQDAHEYLRYTRRLADWMQGGTVPGDYFWPLNYPLYGAVLSLILGAPILSLQLLSLVSIIATAFLLREILLGCWPEKKEQVTPYVLIFFLAAPYLLRSGLLIMSDAFACFFLCLFFLAYFRYWRQASGEWLLLAAFAAGSAVMTRYAAGVLLFLPGMHLLFGALRKKQWLWIIAGGAIIGLVSWPHFLIRCEHAAAFLGHAFLDNWSMVHWFRQSFTTQASSYHYALPNIVYGFYALIHPGYCFLGGILIFFWRKKDFATIQVRIILLSFMLYALFLAGIPFQNNRFLLLAFPLSLILLYPAVQRGYGKLGSRNSRLMFWLVICLVQAALFYRAMQTFVRLNHLEQTIAHEVNALPPNKMYTFYVDLALQSYQTPHELVNLWKAPLEEVAPGELVLFHPTKFQQQWEGHVLMQNWSFLLEKHHLKPIKDLPGGWKLYQTQ